MLTWQRKEQNQRNWNCREKLNSQARSTYQFKHRVLYIHKAPKYIISYKTLTHKITQHPLFLFLSFSLAIALFFKLSVYNNGNAFVGRRNCEESSPTGQTNTTDSCFFFGFAFIGFEILVMYIWVLMGFFFFWGALVYRLSFTSVIAIFQGTIFSRKPSVRAKMDVSLLFSSSFFSLYTLSVHNIWYVCTWVCVGTY